MACIAHAATLGSRIPFLHFFDGFRTSHEIAKVETLTDDDLRHMTDQEAVAAHRARALTPDRPVLRGSAQNPDTFFQAREACNSFYDACPGVVEDAMARFSARTGRTYRLFDYVGAPDAERVIVVMGSGAETVAETVRHCAAQGDKVGAIVVRLYRPFSVEAFCNVLPSTTQRIAVLDRTKEPGAIGEPLYLDVVAAINEAVQADTLTTGVRPLVFGGRYGLSSKEFTPAMVKAVFDTLATSRPPAHFTVGITDDVTRLSLDVDESFEIEQDDVMRAVFFGLGSDGTVGANKNSIKIIGEETDLHAQGYFVYDSKKSGAITISHLRFGPRPIRAPYLIRQAHFIGCHQFSFLDKQDVIDYAAPGARLLINAPCAPDQLWNELPREVQEQIIDKKLRVFTIDADKVAAETGMGRRVNTIMQTCFFALSDVLPRDEAIEKIKQAIRKTYAKKGDAVVKRNCDAVDATLEHLHGVTVPPQATSMRARPPIVAAEAPDFVQRVSAVMMAGHGDGLPVSAFPVDGTWPTGTAKWEKRGIALEIPIWEPDLCIQCNKCAMVCPHAAIRASVFEAVDLTGAPDSFRSRDYKAHDLVAADNGSNGHGASSGDVGMKFTIQVAPEDCTGCTLCVRVCPAKDKREPRRKAINMQAMREHVDAERDNYAFFERIPEIDRTRLARLDVKQTQFMLPLFEYSGACAGCGETPYLKLLSQLFGDRLMIANATGCSSIYGGNLPTTPFTVNAAGRGPAWSNSLFEDNAEFGFGMRMAVNALVEHACNLLERLAGRIGEELVAALFAREVRDESSIRAQRERVARLREKLAAIEGDDARRLEQLADYLVYKSIWLVGGDGWAFDIGYGGLDHVLAQRQDVNVLVLDTEVYSNTGGQASKATPIGAAAKFASTGKAIDKKDLGLMAMNYGHVYVASIAFGAKDAHTVTAMREAESYDGPSLIIAYSHCIAHGYDLAHGLDQQKRAVDSGVWPLYRYDPRRIDAGEPPLVIDAPAGRIPVTEYMKNEMRFAMVERIDRDRFRKFAEQAQTAAQRRIAMYQHLAALRLPAHHTHVVGDDDGDRTTTTRTAAPIGTGRTSAESQS
jgi:pyruvate-ferredoxin/flavodoxin oxidoreductase